MLVSQSQGRLKRGNRQAHSPSFGSVAKFPTASTMSGGIRGEKAANVTGSSSRNCIVRVVPTVNGVLCDLCLAGPYPPDAGLEFALKATRETFNRRLRL